MNIIISCSVLVSISGIMASVQETVVAVAARRGKKASAGTKKPRVSPSHPPYSEMIKEAILALKERTGSSQFAIAKFIEEKQKTNLPANFKKHLLVQLKKLVAAEKLVKVKNSFKLPPAVAKKSAAAVKPEGGKAPAKKKPAAKPKPAAKGKTTESGKAKATAVKAKKAMAKPKPKARPSTKASAAKSPGKKAAGPAKAVKKAPAKAVKKTPVKAAKNPKSIKSPAKKAKK